MNELFVPYQQSFDMKELGFDEPCFTSFDNEGELRNPFDFSEPDSKYIGDSKHFVYNSELTIDNFNGPKHLYTQFIAAPTFSQAFKFFRDKYKLTGLIHIGTQEFSYSVNKNGSRISSLREYLEYNGTYEEAELECLKQLIEITKSGSLKA